MTGIKLERISDIDMYLFRGGISYICKRHNKSNSKDIKIMNLQIRQNT